MFIPIYDSNRLVKISWQYVTISIIVLNCLVLAVSLSGSAGLHLQDYAIAFGLIPNEFIHTNLRQIAISDPILLTAPISYAFLHAGWMHLLGNMAFLWVFGDNIEDAMGHFRFLLFYCLCAMGAALTHILANWGSAAPLIGASGAVAGIIAAYLMLYPNIKVWILVLWRIPIRVPALYCLGAWLLVQVYYSLISTEETVSWWAHVGGAITGIILIPLMKRRSVKLFAKTGT